jgi:ubiquinone/menaquinone biosynthesis C-methylase UbiE
MLVELAEIKPGQRILDIATGIGEPALTAARIVGSTGHILAIDISTEMIAIAKQRAASNGFPRHYRISGNRSRRFGVTRFIF